MRMNYFLAGVAILWSSTGFGATPWEVYVAVPSPQHAKVVAEPVYSTPEAGPTTGASRLELDLGILSAQIRSGDTEAFYLGLRLRQSSNIDGALAEFLDIRVADFLRIRPEAFLTGLTIYATKNCAEAVYTDPDIYEDRFNAEGYELGRRLEAITAVQNPKLRAIRELCSQALRSAIDADKSH
jgi:hypothetical protein